MSLIHEIHAQKPAVRYTLFGLSLLIALSLVGIFGLSALQRQAYLALHTDPGDQQAYDEAVAARRPKPIAAFVRAASSLTASIGSVFGWKSDAGFDTGGRLGNDQGGVHPLPLSE
ncbi:MAG: hypothetical protein IT406_02480 [Candidatus Yanofskybacteria bacterium]|nr:hypothetical protein [Candidatus Yanofskybacteria bacterium]